MSKISNNSNAGVATFNIIETGALFVNGKRLKDAISELISEDQFEQSEITELKQLVQYLNTSGLSSEWIVDNQSVNQSLKALITALETKTAQLDTTALTEPWVITNANKNSVLKTDVTNLQTKTSQLDTTALTEPWVITNTNKNSTLRTLIDGLTASLGPIEGKTRYITSTIGDNNANPKTLSEHQIIIANAAQKKRILLSTFSSAVGFFNINLTGDDSLGNPEQAGEDTWAANNRIDITNTYGNIEMTCRKAHIQGKVEIGDFGENTTDRRPINIGGSMARINIGSEKTPKTGTGPGDPDTNDSTIITIGKLGNLKNTWTYLNGNIYTSDARFESLSKSQALTVGALLSIITSSGLPLYINIFSALGLSSYVHSDLWGLAGTLVKNGDVATTNDIKVKSYSLYNTDVNFVDLFPVENTFIASGSSSKTLLLGSIKEQVFKNGSDITLRHNNILATNINWALSEANDNVNALCIKGNDGILLHQGASTVGASMKILNSKSGKIELLIGNAGTQASCLTGLTVDWNSGQPQVICGTKGGLQNAQQNNSKLLVQQSDTAGDVGIEIVKNGISPANAPLSRTTISDNNVDTHSLSLKTNFTGTTTKALYLDAGDNLRYNGNLVTPVQNVVGSQFINVTNNNGTYTITRDSDNLIGQSLQLYSNYTGGTTRTLYLDSVNNLKFDGNLVTPVKDIVAGAHISVTNNNGVYTIARTGGGGGGSVADVGEDLVISATATQIPRKSGWYGQSFVRFSPISRMFFDVYMSGNGKYIYWANRATNGTAATILSSSVYANTSYFTESNVSKLWITICGTSEGNRVFACGSNEIWSNTTPSTTWTQSTTPPNFAGATPVQMRCNGDGKYQLITDARAGSGGAIYKSNDYGVTWTQQNLTGTTTRALGCCVNASGKTQYVVLDGTNNGANAENGFGGLYRSQDYGATWARIFGVPNGQHQRVSCDATGRYLGLVGSFSMYTSKDYGATWVTHSILDSYSIYVSHTGDFMWMGRNASSNNYYFSTDYGNTFTLGNTSPDGSYIGMSNACIACNNDGSIVVSGSISGQYIQSFRESPNEVRVLTTQGNSGITITDLGTGQYQLASSSAAITNIGLRYGGPLTALVNFNMPQSYSLATHRATGRAQLFVTNLFDYPVIRISGAGDITTAANTNEQSHSVHTYYQSPATNQENPYGQASNYNWLDRSCCFNNINNPNACEVLLEFTIDLIRDPQGSVGGANSVVRGRATWISKAVGQTPTFKMYTFFERHTIATTLSQITLGSFGGYDPSVSYANLQVEIIPLPTF